MTATTVTLLDRMTFDAQVGDHHVMIDAASGHGDNRGPTPSMLTLAGLAGCTAMDVASILRKKRQPFTSLVVRAEGEEADDYPHRYTRVTLVYEVGGEGVDRAAVERAVQLSEEKYCSVSATFRESTEIATRVDLPDAGSE